MYRSVRLVTCNFCTGMITLRCMKLIVVTLGRCTRENRHRGVCNNRASVPGANSSPGSNLAAQTPGLDDCSLDGQLAAAPVKEDPEHSQRAASEEGRLLGFQCRCIP